MFRCIGTKISTANRWRQRVCTLTWSVKRSVRMMQKCATTSRLDAIWQLRWESSSQYMMWYDMICYAMLCYAMLCYAMTMLCCAVMWCDVMWCDVIWYDMIWYDMIWYDMIWYDMICDAMWCDMKWYGIELFVQWQTTVVNFLVTCLFTDSRNAVKTFKEEIQRYRWCKTEKTKLGEYSIFETKSKQLTLKTRIYLQCV